MSGHVGSSTGHRALCRQRLFQQEGYSAVSMRKVAAEAGCTPKTVSACFDSKIDILGLLWSEVFATLFDRLHALAMAETDPRDRLHAVSRAYVAFCLENREHYFLVFMPRGLSRTDVEGFVATGMPRARFELFVRCLAAVLGEAVDLERLRQRGEVLICALNGICQALITISGHDWASPEALVILNAPVPCAPRPSRTVHMSMPVLRIARPTDNIGALLPFYRDGLGLEVLGHFEDHVGFDGVMLGKPGGPYHFEFTHQRGHAVGRAPTQDHLVVFYLPEQSEWEAAVSRMRETGHEPVAAYNPYWDTLGATFEDADGYRVVLQRARW